MKSVNQGDLELVVVGWMKYVLVCMSVHPWALPPYPAFQWKLKSDL